MGISKIETDYLMLIVCVCVWGGGGGGDNYLHTHIHLKSRLPGLGYRGRLIMNYGKTYYYSSFVVNSSGTISVA